MSSPEPADAFLAWLAALEQRHLSELRIPEVTRALRALSSAYVERRHTVARGAPLDSAGKRAAFALYYAPLHFLTTLHVVRGLGADADAPASILDIGCGTGAGGAAWAVAAGGGPSVTGIDRHPWAVNEARWTYQQFRLRAQARQGDAARLPPLKGGGAIAAYAMNELAPPAREALEQRLMDEARNGGRVLIIEPIARGITPWWEGSARKVRDAGGRADEWRFAVELPPLLALFDKAAGLRHQELTARSLYL